MRRMFEVNVFGYAHGMRAALERFRRRGRGVLINNVSIYGKVTSPYWSMYAATKWAVRGMTDAVRQELRGTNIHICTVLPSSIDTPLWQHAANLSNRLDEEFAAEAAAALARQGLDARVNAVGHVAVAVPPR